MFICSKNQLTVILKKNVRIFSRFSLLKWARIFQRNNFLQFDLYDEEIIHIILCFQQIFFICISFKVFIFESLTLNLYAKKIKILLHCFEIKIKILSFSQIKKIFSLRKSYFILLLFSLIPKEITFHNFIRKEQVILEELFFFLTNKWGLYNYHLFIIIKLYFRSKKNVVQAQK